MKIQDFLPKEDYFCKILYCDIPLIASLALLFSSSSSNNTYSSSLLIF